MVALRRERMTGTSCLRKQRDIRGDYVIIGLNRWSGIYASERLVPSSFTPVRDLDAREQLGSGLERDHNPLPLEQSSPAGEGKASRPRRPRRGHVHETEDVGI